MTTNGSTACEEMAVRNIAKAPKHVAFEEVSMRKKRTYLGMTTVAHHAYHPTALDQAFRILDAFQGIFELGRDTLVSARQPPEIVPARIRPFSRSRRFKSPRLNRRATGQLELPLQERISLSSHRGSQQYLLAT